MKYKTTRKEIVNNYSKILSVGYCDLQSLLRVEDPIAYTCGVYGWNFDLYYIDGVAICTGYRNMPGRTAKNVEEYEKKARSIWEDYNRTYEEQKSEVEKLLHEFIAQA